NNNIYTENIVAEDDCVFFLPRAKARQTAEASMAREAKEARSRAAFQEGELGLDRYGLRETLERLGVTYRSYEEYITGDAS
ncbi:hypothetical protein ACFC18_53600, partial [Streptomyces sp. NPDC056121]